LWGTGFGKLSFLKRLPGRVLTRRQYDDLVTALIDPRQRHLLQTMLKDLARGAHDHRAFR
jgi:NADH dehydrogenase FAD-containing subunit